MGRPPDESAMDTDHETNLLDAASARRQIERRGRQLARELDIDESSFLVASNLHWTSTLMRTYYERVALADDDLSMSAFVALWTLRVAGELEGRTVAAEVGIARSSFSGLAKRLEKRGLVQRRDHPEDGRAVLFSLTEDGVELIDRVWPRVGRAERDLSAHLGPSEQRALADTLRSLADRLTILVDEGAH